MSERKKSATKRSAKSKERVKDVDMEEQKMEAKSAAMSQAVDDAKNRAKVTIHEVQNVSEWTIIDWLCVITSLLSHVFWLECEHD